MSTDSAKHTDTRREFVHYLYGLNAALGGHPTQAANARQILARLRRSFGGPAQEIEAYDVVLSHDPPPSEVRVWLLLAGLFAIHPHPRTAAGRSLGAAMRLLAAERGASAERRFTQLLSVDRAALPHYLRQAVQLLRTEQVAVDYHRLLGDLVPLLTTSLTGDQAHRIRLNWASDFYRPIRTETAEPETAPATT